MLLPSRPGRIAVPLALLLPPLVAAQANGRAVTPVRPLAQAVRVETGPVLTGRLDDTLWSHARVVTAFVEHEPFEGRPATERTEVRILFDRQALYIGARLYDSHPAGIVHGEVRRDADLKDQDSFVIMLDTY